MSPDQFKELYISLFNQTETPICVVKADAPQFTVIAVNNSFKASTSTDITGMIGKGVFDIYRPYDEQSTKQFDLIKNALGNCLQEKRPVRLPVLHFDVINDGLEATQRTYWQFELNPVLDGSNIVEYIMCVTRNVTEQENNKNLIAQAGQREEALLIQLKTVNEELEFANAKLKQTVTELSTSKDELHQLNNQLEDRVYTRTQQLAASEAKFKSILNFIPQIAWTSSVDGNVTFYNNRWYEYTGLNFEQTKSWGWKEVIHPDDIEYNLSAYAAILKNDIAGEFEIREKRHDGVYKWHLVRIEPLRNAEGKIELWIGTATDIQELKDEQQKKDDFISIASHELKTPLTALSATLQYLNQKKDNSLHTSTTKLISQANKSMVKVETLITRLLNASQINSKGLKLNKTWFSLLECVQENIADLAAIYKRQIIINGQDVTIYADEFQIGQVVVNLISNAIKYSPAISEVLVDVSTEETKVKLSVTDYGTGISEDQQPLLFDRYFRGHGNEVQYSGIGLGLYICSKVIAEHEGNIGVNSQLGKGSTFWFTLPL
ncbi:PAS domain S-box protein [Inquilinus sp. KBS0705]|nr:PAS domain S-box protein [Inquilinus sp. KBS0705]